MNKISNITFCKNENQLICQQNPMMVLSYETVRAGNVTKDLLQSIQ